MNDERLPWFPCYPSKLLGAFAAMKPDEGYVYWIVCLRIYEIGGPCPDTLDALVRRTGLNKRRVSDALERLFKGGKLLREQTGIMNPFAAKVMTDVQSFREDRSRAGQKGARVRWEKPELKQSNDDGTANAQAMANDSHLHLHRHIQKKERIESVVKRTRAKARSPLPDDWVLSLDDLQYALSRNFNETQARQMTEPFANHHRGRGNLMADWSAAWRTWVTNEIKFAQNRQPPKSGSSTGQRTFADIARGVNR